MTDRAERLERLAWRASLRAHGRDALWTPATGDPLPVRGVFDNAHKTVELGLGGDSAAGLSGTAPAFSVCLADLPAPPQQGDGLRLAGVDYAVVDIRPDGHGGAHLILHRA